MNSNKLERALDLEVAYLNTVDNVLSRKTLDNTKEIILTKVKSSRYGNIKPYIMIKDTIAKLIIKLYNLIKKCIRENYNQIDEIIVKYNKINFRPWRDAVLLYNIVYYLFSIYPDQEFKLSKYQISEKYKYFVYKLTFGDNSVRYVVFQYPDISNQNFLYIFFNKDLLDAFREDFFGIKPKSSASSGSLTSQSSLQNSSFGTNHTRSSKSSSR